MKETEMMFRRLFQACGNCGLSDQIKDLYAELQKLKLDVDKVTMSAYYEALMQCKDQDPSNPF